MRKIILVANITLDGYLEGPAGELDWITPDPGMNLALITDLRRRIDTMLIGRRSYEMFHEAFSEHAAHPDNPPAFADFADWMLRTPKVVFSRSLSEPLASHDRLAGPDLLAEVVALKRDPGRHMLLLGGVGTVQQFVQHDLIDEYWLKVYPSVLGAGRPLFVDLKDRSDLMLTHAELHPSDILTLRYQPV